MQLFLTSFTVQWSELIIQDISVLDQLRKVLRSKKWDTIYVQQDTVRYCVQINDRDNTSVSTTITDTIVAPKNLWPGVVLYVALPNKWDKAELIAQKATEIWVSRLIFWRAERSVLREVNPNKVLRIQKIMQEAVEQSWGWRLPELSFVTDVDWKISDPVVVFDIADTDLVWSTSWKSIGVVGPEGWLTPADYAHFPHHIVSSLGNTILRMETAAIVWSWILKNPL